LGIGALLLLFVVKLVIWSGALGSGTSGGILAPILMLGAALGALAGHLLPGASPGVWALIGLAGSLAGVTRSPFTAIVFAFELTHDANSLLALLVVSCIAFLVSSLTLKRSILTEKVARRGFHVMREYAVDPLEAAYVREVMRTDVVTVRPEDALAEVYRAFPEGSPARRQRLYPVLAEDGRMVGVLPWSAVLPAAARRRGLVRDAMVEPRATARPDEILRTTVDRMAATGVGAMPVVDGADPEQLRGLVSLFDVMAARERLLHEERHAARVLHLLPVPGRPRGVRRRA
jgi:CBS domain-containing protein